MRNSLSFTSASPRYRNTSVWTSGLGTPSQNKCTPATSGSNTIHKSNTAPESLFDVSAFLASPTTQQSAKDLS